jgi:hypothetical protein
MEKYTKGPILGKGTFGEVIQGINKEVTDLYSTLFPQRSPTSRHSPSPLLLSQTGKVVAIKKIIIGEKGEVSHSKHLLYNRDPIIY